jgi:hypothetical protein
LIKSNVPTGVSDCHNIISTVIKGEVFHEPKKLRYYRSYKTFDIENFNDDIEQIKINQTIITSTSDGIHPILKQVEPLTSCDRLKISQKSFKVALLSELSMSKFMSPNNNICS